MVESPLRREYGYFLDLYETRNITIAAKGQFMSRQAFSNSIRKLEKELGAPLFARGKSGVTPTEDGKLLKEFLDQQNALWTVTGEKMRGLKKRESFRVGAHLVHLSSEMVQSIMSYHKIDPAVHITFFAGEEYVEFCRMVKKNELDIALTRQPLPSDELAWIRVEDVGVFFLVNEKNPLSKMKTLDFRKDLSGQHYLSVSNDTLEEMKLYLEEARMIPEFITPSQTIVRETLMHDEGIFAVPEPFVSVLKPECVVAIECTSFPVSVNTHVIYRKNPAPSLKRFINYIVSDVYEKPELTI